MIKFISKDIWPTIFKLSSKSRRTEVAVAYFGSHSEQLLKLKFNDILVVSLDLNTVRLGQVDPYSIEKLYNLGVKIFTVKNLHSKVFIFDDKLISGSSNVSINSKMFGHELAPVYSKELKKTKRQTLKH